MRTRKRSGVLVFLGPPSLVVLTYIYFVHHGYLSGTSNYNDSRYVTSSAVDASKSMVLQQPKSRPDDILHQGHGGDKGLGFKAVEPEKEPALQQQQRTGQIRDRDAINLQENHSSRGVGYPGIPDDGLGEHQEEIDSNGYVIFCLCMGNLGNQFDQFLGTLAFAQKLNRTFVIPTLSNKHTSFTEWFKLGPLLNYHRAILGRDFLDNIAPAHWPQGKRTGFCQSVMPICNMTNGAVFRHFWGNLGLEFDDTIKFKLNHHHDKEIWDQEYPVSQYPVLAFQSAMANYPILAEHRHLQSTLVFSDRIQQETHAFVNQHFLGKKFIAIHLRNGPDWAFACKQGNGFPRYMPSPQCQGYGIGTVTKDVCFPSMKEIIRLTRKTVLDTGIKIVYIATDHKPMHKELQEALQEYQVRVFWKRPRLPIIDLAIMSMSDHFIGNCVSSFTAFVKRARDVAGKPTSFWGQPSHAVPPK